MNFIENMKLLLNLIKYTAKGFSVCKTFQILELKKQVIEWDRVKYYRDRKEYLPDPYDLIWMLYNDIKCGNIESGSFMSSLNEAVEKFPEP